LIICPAGLTVQWQEEMQDKFGQFYEIFQRDFHTINPRIWDLKACAIASLDCLKRKEHKEKLLENRKWDLIIFDEAHRLSARDYGEAKTEKTQNYRLAEDLRDRTRVFAICLACSIVRSTSVGWRTGRRRFGVTPSGSPGATAIGLTKNIFYGRRS
jgi:SNF2 family DNA or RNA helicase